RRRQPDLVSLALARAADPRRAEAVRRGALEVLAILADAPEHPARLARLASDGPPALAPLAQRAAARARGRAATLARLAQPGELTSLDELGAGTLEDLAALAADPLLEEAARGAAVRALARVGGIEEVGLLAGLVLREADALAARAEALAALL